MSTISHIYLSGMTVLCVGMLFSVCSAVVSMLSTPMQICQWIIYSIRLILKYFVSFITCGSSRGVEAFQLVNKSISRVGGAFRWLGS